MSAEAGDRQPARAAPTRGGDAALAALTDPEVLARLSPEQLAVLERALVRLDKKRRLMLAGYLGALLALIGGQVGAFMIWFQVQKASGGIGHGPTLGWIFFIPFLLVGLVLWGAGKLASRVRPFEDGPSARPEGPRGE